MTGVVAVQIGASRRYDGPLGKSDRAFAFGLLAVLLALDFIPAPWPEVLFLGPPWASPFVHPFQPRPLRRLPRAEKVTADGKATIAGVRRGEFCRGTWGCRRTSALVIAVVFGLLILATVIVKVMRRGGGSDRHLELWLRVKSWWYMVAIFTFAVVVGRNLSIAFLGFISFLALKEYLSMIPTRRADRRVLFWVYLAIPLQYYWVADVSYGMFLVFIPVWMFLFLPFRMILTGESKGFLKSLGTLNWGLMITVFSLSHAAYLIVLPEAPRPGIPGGACRKPLAAGIWRAPACSSCWSCSPRRTTSFSSSGARPSAAPKSCQR